MAKYGSGQRLEREYRGLFVALLAKGDFADQTDPVDYGVDVRAEAIKPTEDPGGDGTHTGAYVAFQLKAADVGPTGDWAIRIEVDRLLVLENQAGLSCIVGYDQRSQSFRALPVEPLVRALDRRDPGWRNRPSSRLRLKVTHPVTPDWLKNLSSEARRMHEALCATKTGLIGSPAAKAQDLEALVRVCSELPEAVNVGLRRRHKDAVSLIKAGRFGEARALLEQVIALAEKAGVPASKMTAAHENLGGVLDDLGEGERAVEVLRKAVAQPNATVNANLNLANAYFGLKRFEEARGALEEAQRLDPSHVGVRTLTGLMLKQDGKVIEAREAFEALLSEHRREAACYFNLGQCHELLGDTDAALRVALKGLRVVPKTARSRYLLSILAAEMLLLPDQKAIGVVKKIRGHYVSLTFGLNELISHRPIGASRALRLLRRAKAPNPKAEADLLVMRATAATFAGRFALVVKYGRDLAKLPGHHVAGKKAIAMGMAFQGKWLQAARTWEEVLALSPGNRDALLGLGQCYFKLEDGRKALQFAREAALDPEASSGAVMNLIFVCQRWLSPSETADVCREVLDVHSHERDLHRLLMDSLRSFAPSAEREASARMYLAQWPDDHPARMFLIHALGDAAKYGEAAGEYAKLRREDLTPRDLVAWAATLTRTRRWEEATRLLDDAERRGLSGEAREEVAMIRMHVSLRTPVPIRGSSGLLIP